LPSRVAQEERVTERGEARVRRGVETRSKRVRKRGRREEREGMAAEGKGRREGR